MTEEIDFGGSETPTPSLFGAPPRPVREEPEEIRLHARTQHTETHTETQTSTRAPPQLRLPRTGGGLQNRAAFLRDSIRSQIGEGLGSPRHAAQLQKRKEQAGRLVLEGLGNGWNKIQAAGANLGGLIDRMERDQELADSLESLNSRMREEAERQELRREAESLSKKVITDHLSGFLEEHPQGTYEEWISDLHPENANQGLLFSDIQQIDDRFYVQESDHRMLWNTAVENQHAGTEAGSYAHRLVKARTQIWGKAPGAETSADQGRSNSSNSNNNSNSNKKIMDGAIDLLSASIDFRTNKTATATATTTTTTTTTTSTDTTVEAHCGKGNDSGIEEIDFFAPVVGDAGGSSSTTTSTSTTTGGGGGLFAPAAPQTTTEKKADDPFRDLISF